ncbi:hypothetical protein BC828DRAFT_378702 [Blastocladiella britannica]|nr:hypothetical protein BC828DRAFT_378702 [Blastocladiella britannica]
MAAIEFTARLAESLRVRGLDLTVPFAVQVYNAAVPSAFALPTFGHGRTLGILVANSRALWPAFTTFVRAHPDHVRESNPLDRYVTLMVDQALADARAGCSVALETAAEIRHSWETAPGRMVAIQRLCTVSGLAALDEASHLCVHAEFGPWIALRTAIVLHLPMPPELERPAAVNPVPPVLVPYLTRILHRLVPPGTHYHMQVQSDRDDDKNPDTLEGLNEYSLALIAENDARAARNDPASWRDWLLMRDLAASWMGRSRAMAARYTDEALQYHYTKETIILAGIINGGGR